MGWGGALQGVRGGEVDFRARNDMDYWCSYIKISQPNCIVAIGHWIQYLGHVLPR